MVNEDVDVVFLAPLLGVLGVEPEVIGGDEVPELGDLQRPAALGCAVFSSRLGRLRLVRPGPAGRTGGYNSGRAPPPRAGSPAS
jgi:hypothetical protein